MRVSFGSSKKHKKKEMLTDGKMCFQTATVQKLFISFLQAKINFAS